MLVVLELELWAKVAKWISLVCVASVDPGSGTGGVRRKKENLGLGGNEEQVM